MRRPRTLALLSVAVTAGLAVLVAAAAPASAGGPTSVLVVDYDGARAGAALTGSAAYADLEKALSPYDPPRGDRTAPASFMGTSLRLTWLIHDVTPWRVDAVTLDGDDVWVETTMSIDGSTDLFSAPSVRHRPTDAALLLRTLRSLGVIGDATPASAAGSTPTPGAAPGTHVPVAAAPPTGAATATGLPWPATVGLAGLALVLGVVTGFVARPRVRRRFSAPAPAAPAAAAEAAEAEAAGVPRRPEAVGFSADPRGADAPSPSARRPSRSSRT
ncbi:hypothetical protein [Intrasporangium sp. YIM S08009]|uniref:hypothetical protein n=1 Tax=Intrasporangium zincisolvens TaxID=3080018 RepID=UPI002B056326|nr:hypothetical protein [Intrasporangium sp. YIM S08009]